MTPGSRAPRFQIAEKILWRRQDLETWSEATSINASRTGVLFRCELDPHIDVGTPVEFILGFSSKGDEPVEMADVRCSARVVRTEKVDAAGEQALIAAAIQSYTFIALP